MKDQQLAVKAVYYSIEVVVSATVFTVMPHGGVSFAVSHDGILLKRKNSFPQ